MLKRLSLNSQTQKLEPPSTTPSFTLGEKEFTEHAFFAQWSYMVMDELLCHVVSPCITRKNRFTTVQYNASLHLLMVQLPYGRFMLFSCAKCCRLSLILSFYCYFFLSNFSGDLLMKVKVQCPVEGAASVVLLALI